MVGRVTASLRRRAARLKKRKTGTATSDAAGPVTGRARLLLDVVEGNLLLGGRVSTSVAAVTLVARTIDSVTTVPLDRQGPEFEVAIPLATFVDAAAGASATFELLLVDHAGETLERVGRFLATSRPERRLAEAVNGVEVAVDITVHGNVVVHVGRSPSAGIAVATVSSTQVGETLELTLAATARDGLAAALLRFRGRQTETSFEIPVAPSLDNERTPREFGRLVYQINASIDLVALFAAVPPSEEVVDVYLVTRGADGDERAVRILAHPDVMNRRARSLVAAADGMSHLLVPYATVLGSQLCFRREQLARDDYLFLMKWARRWPLMAPIRWLRPVWLVGEVPYKAQDNGLHLFRYIRTQHPRRRAYYVIDRDSPDLKRVAELGNEVYYGSREHIRLALRASRFVGSHHAEYLYPSRDPQVAKAMRGVRIFMRHGIGAMKNMKHVYGRHMSTPRPTERFLVSSERERDVVVESYGYRRSQVVVTGLARFDALLNHPPAPQRTILVMPTWRGDLLREEAFLASDYFAQWRGFLLSKRLAPLLAEHDATITLVLHPNMRKYARYFEHPSIQQVHPGEADVQHLLRTSSMLVTDMSSVAWDFSFLRRPVAFFLFDLEKMTRKREAHIDFATELPGPVVTSIDALCDAIEDQMRSGFAVSDADYAKARVFLAHNDLRSRERVYSAVKHAWRPVTAVERLRDWRAHSRRTHA